MSANLYALAAIGLWAMLASLGVSLKHVPPFLLTGVALLVGSLLSVPFVLRDGRQWRVAPRMLGLGVFTLFGFHFLLFIALRIAPAVEVNLINYLWPLLMVVLAPWYLPGVRLGPVHAIAAVIGFAGAAIAILGGRDTTTSAENLATLATPALSQPALGYALALGAALIWGNYSLQTKRMALKGTGASTAAIGLFGMVSGVLSLLCHWALEPSVPLSVRDWLLMAVTGLGPLGAAFYLWDQALKLGDTRHIAVLSYLTPLLSTVLLIAVTGRALSASIGVAALLIIGAALLGTRRTP